MKYPNGTKMWANFWHDKWQGTEHLNGKTIEKPRRRCENTNKRILSK